MRAVVHGLKHFEQATEQAWQRRVIADAFCAYVEKCVAGWLCLQMLQVTRVPFARVLQSRFSLAEFVIAFSPFFTSLLHFVHGNCDCSGE